MSLRPQVFVSSTYIDNLDRRETVEDAIIRSKMLPAGMERFAASHQPAVDECLRHVRESELFVLIVAHRYGWMPPGSNRSITELEYDEAKRHGKPCFVFLVDETVAVDMTKDLDAGPDKWDKQKKLEEFRAKVSADQMPARFTDATLGVIVMQTLQEWASARATADSEGRTTAKQKRASRPKQPPRGTPKAARAAHNEFEITIERYLQRLVARHENITLAGFETRVRVPIRLDDLYVPLRGVVDARANGSGGYADAEDAMLHVRGESDLPLSEAFDCARKLGRPRRGIVMLGDPGSGKTTQLKRVLLSVARHGPESVGLPPDCVPVLVPLRELADVGGELMALVRRQLADEELGGDAAFATALLERDNLVFLFDGLDEVSASAEREHVARAIEKLSTRMPKSHVAVTCRYAGYTVESRLDGAFLELHLRPFTREQSEEFIYRWFEIVETSLATDVVRARAKAREQAHDLVERLRQPEFRAQRVLELTRNPLLLTAICLVHRDRGRLPERRGKLYHECVRILLELWREAKKLTGRIDEDRALRVLQPLALHLHEHKLTRASVAELEPVLAKELAAIRWTDRTAREFLATIRDESGLLTGWSNDTFGFMHLGFQEYLAALAIRDGAFDQPELLERLAERFGESWWQEVTLLVAALEGPSVSDKFFTLVLAGQRVVEDELFFDLSLNESVALPLAPMLALLEQPPAKDRSLWDRQLVVARALKQRDSLPDALREKLSRHPDARLAQLVGRVLSLTGHAYGGSSASATITATRTSARGEIELVRIPAGRFVMGSSAAEIAALKQEYPDYPAAVFDREGPEHEVELSAFYMARTPVTNEQYARFLAESSGMREPGEWGNRQFNQPNQPVVAVSLEEASAFCAWAGVRLPTEAEWEFACRAGTRSRYWKGDTEHDLAAVGWFGGNSGGRLHAVGEKPANAFGLFDVHGNVWEWCADWLAEYSAANATDPSGAASGSDCVVRGGSFWNMAEGCRSASRVRYRPANRSRVIGFRVALPAPRAD